MIAPHESALVILNSCHTKAHVRAELEAYHGLVGTGSFIAATDGIMSQMHDVPRGHRSWKDDQPSAAAAEFVAEHPEFNLQQPAWPFNESTLNKNVMHWPGAWLQRK